ncbi:MAG: SigB/SigF/SigG family RNA polymerase sigma factor [Roseburia sp.]
MDETMACIRQAQEGDKAAKEKLVTDNLGLVWSVVKRFANRGRDPEELFQIGSIGLLKAIERFDTNYEVCFSTYAVPVIMGEIRRFLRDDGMIRVSRGIKEKGIRVNAARADLTKRLCREPTLEEIAAETGLSLEEIAAAGEANVEVESIYRSVYQADGSELFLVDRLADQRNAHEASENRILVQELMEGLDEKERKLIELRYYENATQSETARCLGTSQVQISRMEKKLLQKLRKRVLQS